MVHIRFLCELRRLFKLHHPLTFQVNFIPHQVLEGHLRQVLFAEVEETSFYQVERIFVGYVVE